MNNFLEFINKDIEAKRLLISSMPIKTKPNQKKLNKDNSLIYLCHLFIFLNLPKNIIISAVVTAIIIFLIKSIF